MSKANVVDIEGKPEASDATRLYFSSKIVGGQKSSIVYLFSNEKLVVVLIQLSANPKHTEEYLAAFEAWLINLRAKYGPGSKRGFNPSDNSISGSFQWTTERSEIALLSTYRGANWKASKNKLSNRVTELGKRTGPG